MKQNLIILRGCAGSGKSTFADLIAEPKCVCTADDYFMVDGVYKFDATKLGQAHKACQDKFLRVLDNPAYENIVICNTNCKSSDYSFYVKEANARGIRITFVVLEKRHNETNVHNCSPEVIERQYNNLMADLKLK